MQRTRTETDIVGRASAGAQGPDELPTQLGRYTIVRRIGRGAMGEVYEAERPEPGTPHIAIKAIRGMSPDALYRFKKEFRALANVRHPNVIALHELAVQGDRMFFSMELVEGSTFIEHLCGPPRGGGRTIHDPCSDFSAVRAALRQLAEGVDAIHRAGFLHRDLKPSNVMIETGGRVVILDFGLVRGIDGDEGLGVTADGAVLGTPLFMSPEQASGGQVGRASDWYTVGEMLYQALTGRPPYSGMGLIALLAAKKEQSPAPPLTLRPGIPEDLNQMCVDLLARDPATRPAASEVLERLGADAPTPRHEDSSPHLFLGRDEELEALRQAVGASRTGKPVVVLLEGVSGIGKSALVERFLRSVATDNTEAIVLRGKCSERESIPYKALDSVMDMLSGHLRAMPTAAEVQALLPRDVGAVARLFPVLLSVPAIALAPLTVHTDVMPQEARRQGIESMRELLGRIADRRPLLIYIDDLQWSDLDSLVVLEAILHATDAPPLLLVCSFREGAPERVQPLGRFIADLHSVEPLVDLRTVRLGPMGAEDATGLAMRMLGGTTRTHRALAEEVAREAEGSPFFVAELVRHTQRAQQGDMLQTDSAVSLHDVIRHRLSSLPAVGRRLLSVLAIAGGRLGAEIIEDICRADMSFHGTLGLLRTESLVRTDGAGEVEIYHDRIRETVLRDLNQHEAARLHLAIGQALARSTGPDAVALSHHFREAGEDKLASLHTIEAADQAAEALAFGRAAELYKAALELGATPPDDRPALEVKYGQALAGAGEVYDAAKVLWKASEGSPAALRPDLLRQATELLLTSGHSKEGRVVLQEMLASVSLGLPKSVGRAIGSLLRNRAALALGGLKYRVRSTDEIDAHTLGQLDACWTTARGLIYTDGLVGVDFHARHLRLALRSGDRVRISRALGFEAYLLVSLKPRAKRVRAFEMLDEARSLAEDADSDYARGMVDQAKGHAYIMLGEWEEATRCLDRAVETFRERTQETQEIGYCESHAALCLQFMGRARELAPRAQELLRSSTQRVHPYAQGFARGILGHIVYLVDDRHEEAWEQLELYREQAPWGFQAHSLNYVSQSSALMRYRGEVEDAWELCQRRSPEVEKFDLLRAPHPRAEFLFWHAQNALALAQRTSDNAALLKLARAKGKRLLSFAMPYRQAYGHLTLASVASMSGKPHDSAMHLRSALAGFDAHGMQHLVAVCAGRLALLTDGDEASALRARAQAYVDAESIAAPKKFFEMISPGSQDAF